MNLVFARDVLIYQGWEYRRVSFRAHCRLRNDSQVAENGHKRPRNLFSIFIVGKTTWYIPVVFINCHLSIILVPIGFVTSMLYIQQPIFVSAEEFQ